MNTSRKSVASVNFFDNLERDLLPEHLRGKHLVLIGGAVAVMVGFLLSVGVVAAFLGGRAKSPVAAIDGVQPPGSTAPIPVNAASASVVNCNFGQEIHSNDLVIKIDEVKNEMHRIRSGGSEDSYTFLTAVVHVKNTSRTKIAKWKGWHHEGPATDEHGNTLKSIDCGGLTFRQGHYTGDCGSRIDPGETYSNAIYWEGAPKTSQKISFSVPLDGKTVRFTGLLGDKVLLDNEAALRAKTGQVLDGNALLRDLASNSKTVKTDYPIGCMLRVRGDVYIKGPSRTGAAYEIWLKCKDIADHEVTAICYTGDKALYTRLRATRGILGTSYKTRPADRPCDTVTLLGKLGSMSESGQITLSDCTESK